MLHRFRVLSRVLVGCIVTLLGSSPALAEDPAPLPPSHSVTPQLFVTGLAFAEGPALDEAGNLYVVNYRSLGTIGRVATDGTASVLCDLKEIAPIEGRTPQANGLKVDRFHRLIVADAGGGRLLRIPIDGSSSELLADRFQGTRFSAINDVALDAAQNIYFTDPGGSSLDNPVGAVYRYDAASRNVQRISHDLAFPNGVGVTPDQKHLCVAESQRHRILIYDIQDDGEVGNRRTLIDFPQADQDNIRGGPYYPDGLIFDAAGRLYVAMWTGGVVNVVDVNSGELLRQYDAGGSKATNCHFWEDRLYVTVAAKEAVFRLDLGVPGFKYYKP